MPMQDFEYYKEVIEQSEGEPKVIEEWLFRQFIREILNENITDDIANIKMYKAQNKKWKILALEFPDIIHPKTFVRNVRRNINGEFFTWRWWFV
jgi:hypothetical protein